MEGGQCWSRVSWNRGGGDDPASASRFCGRLVELCKELHNLTAFARVERGHEVSFVFRNGSGDLSERRSPGRGNRDDMTAAIGSVGRLRRLPA